ncbi:MAG TPA: hydroxymethylbilane synthase [Desulfomonilia bacterium]
MKNIRIGTRGSALALAQTEIVKNLMLSADPGLNIEVMVIKTEGDVSTEPLAVIGGKGVFVKEIENYLLSGGIDMAVHSLKDMQSISPEGLTIAAYLLREDPCDMLFSSCGYTIRNLPESARVGTSSLRRICQLKNIRPDVECVEIRGNVTTRLKRIDKDLDAVILAAAGIKRLGLSTGTAIDLNEMVPSPGQGIIAIETRQEDEKLNLFLEKLNDPDTRTCALAERGFLARLGADCRIPVAAHARIVNNEISMSAMLATADGSHIARTTGRSLTPEIGAVLAETLLVKLGGKS